MVQLDKGYIQFLVDETPIASVFFVLDLKFFGRQPRFRGAFTKGITPDPHPKWADITEDAEVLADLKIPTLTGWYCFQFLAFHQVVGQGIPARLQGSVENDQTSNVVTK